MPIRDSRHPSGQITPDHDGRHAVYVATAWGSARVVRPGLSMGVGSFAADARPSGARAASAAAPRKTSGSISG